MSIDLRNPSADADVNLTPWPSWQLPILHFLLSLEYSDPEIDEILDYLGRTESTVGCPSLSFFHRELVDDLIREGRDRR